ncbi:hypothetical protein M3M33_14905, partial [Loigolactobacillus coryniformis]|nr:hypothetical protein [Loigolactobacillus coryniformis]
GVDSLTASIIAQGAKYKAAQDSIARMQVPSTSIWGGVAAEYDAETARAAREKERKEKREREETDRRNKANSKEAADAAKAEAKRKAD